MSKRKRIGIGGGGGGVDQVGAREMSNRTDCPYHTRGNGEGIESTMGNRYFNLLAPEFFFNFSTPCILNVNNTGTKYVRFMKQTAF